jgi:CRISPR-associated protein Cas5d
MLIRLRLRGRYACWTSVAHRSERYSSTLPSHEALRGVLRRILGKFAVTYHVERVLLLSEPKREAITSNELKFNNVGFKPVLSVNGQHTQRTTVFIRDPDYLVEFRIALTANANRPEDTLEKYNAMFLRRASRGQQERRPVLGTTECPARIDLITDEDLSSLPKPVNWSENLGISFYGTDWDAGLNGLNYYHPMEIRQGILRYPTWDQVKRFGVTKPVGPLS